MNDFLQALQIPVVHVGLHEVRPRPFVYISQGRRLELAVERIRVLLPFGVDIARASQKVAYSSIDVAGARWIRCVSVLVRLSFRIERNVGVSRKTEVVGGEVGQKRRYTGC